MSVKETRSQGNFSPYRTDIDQNDAYKEFTVYTIYFSHPLTTSMIFKHLVMVLGTDQWNFTFSGL